MFKLVFTVALKAELPYDWLCAKNFPVYTLREIEKVDLQLLKARHQGVEILVLITGVGKENSEKAINFLKKNIQPLFIVNLGTAGTNSKEFKVGDFITPTMISDENGRSLKLDTRLPFPDFNRIIADKLISVTDLNYYFNSAAEPLFFDMEAFFQADLLRDSGISFHAVKVVTDYNNLDTKRAFKENLALVKEKLKLVFSFLDFEGKPEITVIVPTYNRAEMLSNCLASILGQTLLPKEIIVIDDGSRDHTHELVAALANPMIRLITLPENLGVSAARNRGVTAANTAWLSFCDSDDVWLPDKLQNQWAFLRQNPFYEIMQSEDIWVRNQVRVNPCKKHQRPEGWIFASSLNLCLISNSNVLLKKTLFTDFGFHNEALPSCEDYDLYLRISRYKAVGLDHKAAVVRYQGHIGQLSSKYEAMDQFRVQTLFELFKQEQDEDYRSLIKSVLVKKLEILIKGSKKRNYLDKVSFYEKIYFAAR